MGDDFMPTKPLLEPCATATRRHPIRCDVRCKKTARKDMVDQKFALIGFH